MKRIALFSLSMLILLALALPLVAQQRDGSHIFAQPPIRITSPQPDSSSPHGLFPAQIKAAYGLNATPNQGQGQIIGIVDAFDDPNANNLALSLVGARLLALWMLLMTPTPNPTCKFMTLNLTCQFALPKTAASLKLKSATPQATPVGDWKSLWTSSRPTLSPRQPK